MADPQRRLGSTIVGLMLASFCAVTLYMLTYLLTYPLPPIFGYPSVHLTTRCCRVHAVATRLYLTGLYIQPDTHTDPDTQTTMHTPSRIESLLIRQSPFATHAQDGND